MPNRRQQSSSYYKNSPARQGNSKKVLLKTLYRWIQHAYKIYTFDAKHVI